MLPSGSPRCACMLLLILSAGCRIAAGDDEGPPPVASTIPRAAPCATGADYPLPSGSPLAPTPDPLADPDSEPPHPHLPLPHPALPDLPPPNGVGGGGGGTKL